MTISDPCPVAIRTKLDTAKLSGCSVASCLDGPLGCGTGIERYGFFFAYGPQANAIVLIALQGPEGEVIRLWQDAVDCIRKAASGLPYEFTCYMQTPTRGAPGPRCLPPPDFATNGARVAAVL